jgi:hypothetical protein
MGIKELKAYPKSTEFANCTRSGKWAWDVPTTHNPGVLAVVDNDPSHQSCGKRCPLVKDGICRVPAIYTDAKPLTPLVSSINNIYILRFQDKCGNSKCTKEGKTRLGCVQITVDSAKKSGDTWTIKAGGMFGVTIQLEVSASGITVKKDGSKRLIQGATYPNKAVWCCTGVCYKF